MTPATESTMLRNWLQHNIEYIQNIIEKERTANGCSPVASALYDQLLAYQNVIHVMNMLGMGERKEKIT